MKIYEQHTKISLVGWVKERNPTPPLAILGLMLGFTSLRDATRTLNPTYGIQSI
ncbi:MAG TPA: hypothetical protein VK203_19540 [Nostocaceae cyanobacterium]|nr:hypothetical protein [Nostocaceae cyanobacterium]